MKNLDNQSWRAGYEENADAQILDVRTPDEFEEGYIPNAKLLNVQDPMNFTEGIEKLDKDKEYYVYCRSGKRSQMACQVMENMGFKAVNNLATGIIEWDGNIEK
jgi:rhodanese-related sulfurtransferase